LLRQVPSQHLILFSQGDQFFFDRHAPTLLALTPFGKSPAHLGQGLCVLKKRERQDLQSSLRMSAVVAHPSSNGGKSSPTEQTDNGIA
jgi:hypothetical protein